MTTFPRLCPERPLPPYTYVPGQSPHPLSDPGGHSRGVSHPVATPLEPLHWRDCPEYLWGVDLFNAGYYWEAHEAWESVWHAVGRVGAVADLLKGLIKLAAAGVKLYEGRPSGVQRHLVRAAELLKGAAHAAPHPDSVAGLDIPAILAWIPRILLDRPQRPPTAGVMGSLRPR